MKWIALSLLLTTAPAFADDGIWKHGDLRITPQGAYEFQAESLPKKWIIIASISLSSGTKMYLEYREIPLFVSKEDCDYSRALLDKRVIKAMGQIVYELRGYFEELRCVPVEEKK